MIQIQMCLTFCQLSIVDYERDGNKVLARGLRWEAEVRPLPHGGAHDVRGCHSTEREREMYGEPTTGFNQ